MTVPELNTEALRLALSRLRAERGMTYDQLAARSGLDRTVVIDVEMGRSGGSIRTWHALAHALAVRPGDLLDHMCDDHGDPRQETLI